MVELQDTHGCSFGGGQETELRRIRRTGVYALLNELAVSLACKEMDAGQARLAGSKAVEATASRIDQVFPVVGFFLPTISRCISGRNVSP